jgi:hypothetical protein
MSLLPIIEVPDPLLRAQSAPVERVDDELRRLIADMFETMYEAPGIGLAAVQVAVPRRLLVIDLQEPAPGEDGILRLKRGRGRNRRASADPSSSSTPRSSTARTPARPITKAASPSRSNMRKSSGRTSSARAGSTSMARSRKASSAA